eukprot:TRINITY_DN6979_c0_g1_i2.p1 TRINITY_DN6979_c0_g1~~TRINITY_DN6979_c0_g1_i2.p1  ORF type:complete len:251 (-),score=39.76 TRINITY_DN6979_c0_g1_i2:92-844(-)
MGAGLCARISLGLRLFVLGACLEKMSISGGLQRGSNSGGSSGSTRQLPMALSVGQQHRRAAAAVVADRSHSLLEHLEAQQAQSTAYRTVRPGNLSRAESATQTSPAVSRRQRPETSKRRFPLSSTSGRSSTPLHSDAPSNLIARRGSPRDTLHSGSGIQGRPALRHTVSWREAFLVHHSEFEDDDEPQEVSELMVLAATLALLHVAMCFVGATYWSLQIWSDFKGRQLAAASQAKDQTSSQKTIEGKKAS